MKRNIGKYVLLFILILSCFSLLLAGYLSDCKDQKELLVLQKSMNRRIKILEKSETSFLKKEMNGRI